MTEHEEITVIKRTIACKSCGSTDTSKNGIRNSVQYFLCKKCKANFSGTNSYPNMKYPKELNIKTLTYYYNGMSYRNVSKTIEDLKTLDIPKSTYWRWVIKYSKLANNYVLSLQPEIGNIWVADETAVFIWDKQYWFWDIIDRKTRFLLATHLSRTRSEDDAKKLFYMAKLRSKVRPKIIITDKLHSYHGAFNKVFYTLKPEKRAYHLTNKRWGSSVNMQLIERFHGTIKQRTKVMRNMKNKSCARIVLDGFVTHYNFFMEHDYLKGQTPATIGGIGDGIQNWGDLIELSLKTPIKNPEVRLEWEREFHVE